MKRCETITILKFLLFSFIILIPSVSGFEDAFTAGCDASWTWNGTVVVTICSGNQMRLYNEDHNGLTANLNGSNNYNHFNYTWVNYNNDLGGYMNRMIWQIASDNYSKQVGLALDNGDNEFVGIGFTMDDLPNTYDNNIWKFDGKIYGNNTISVRILKSDNSVYHDKNYPLDNIVANSNSIRFMAHGTNNPYRADVRIDDVHFDYHEEFEVDDNFIIDTDKENYTLGDTMIVYYLMNESYNGGNVYLKRANGEYLAVQPTGSLNGSLLFYMGWPNLTTNMTVELWGRIFDDLYHYNEYFLGNATIYYNTSVDFVIPEITGIPTPGFTPFPEPGYNNTDPDNGSINHSKLDEYKNYIDGETGKVTGGLGNLTNLSGGLIFRFRTGIQTINASLNYGDFNVSHNIITLCPCLITSIHPKVKAILSLNLVFVTILMIMGRV